MTAGKFFVIFRADRLPFTFFERELVITNYKYITRRSKIKTRGRLEEARSAKPFYAGPAPEKRRLHRRAPVPGEGLKHEEEHDELQYVVAHGIHSSLYGRRAPAPARTERLRALLEQTRALIGR